jgi:hypothetical protein
MPGCNTGRNIQKYKGAGASTLQDALENGNTASLDVVLQSPAVFIGDGGGLSNINASSTTGNLQAVTNNGATSTTKITLTNSATSLETTGNIVVSTNVYATEFYGDGGTLSNIAANKNFQDVTTLGNTSSLTISFTNPAESITTTGNVIVGTNVHATEFVGDGSSLTSLNADNIDSGDLAIARGGTGVTTGLNVLDPSKLNTAVSISKGGTGQTSASAAATALGLGTGNSPQFTGISLGSTAITEFSGTVSIGSNTIRTGDVALGTQTSGNYVSTVTGGNGIASTGATSGENIAHTLSVDTTSNGGLDFDGSNKLKVNLGASAITGTVAIDHGGTGSTTASGAASALGLGTEDSPQFTGISLGSTAITESTGTVSIGGSVIRTGDISLGTDTTGNYVKTVSAGNGLDMSGSAGEGSDHTLSLDLKANHGLIIDNTELKIDLKTSGGLEFDSGQMRVKLDDTNINGTLPVGKGGTGLSSGFTHGDILFVNTSGTFSKLAADSGKYLKSRGNDTDPIWASVTDEAPATAGSLTAGDGLSSDQGTFNGSTDTVFSIDLLTNGGLVFDGTGTNTKELKVDLGGTSITGTVAVDHGGTGATAVTGTAGNNVLSVSPTLTGTTNVANLTASGTIIGTIAAGSTISGTTITASSKLVGDVNETSTTKNVFGSTITAGSKLVGDVNEAGTSKNVFGSTITAGTSTGGFSGKGSSITGLNATNLSSGVIHKNRYTTSDPDNNSIFFYDTAINELNTVPPNTSGTKYLKSVGTSGDLSWDTVSATISIGNNNDSTSRNLLYTTNDSDLKRDTDGGIKYTPSSNTLSIGDTSGNYKTLSASGWSGKAATADQLTSSVNIGGVSFNGSSGSDIIPLSIQMSDSNDSTDFLIPFSNVTSAGTIKLNSDAGVLTYNPNSGTLKSANFVGNGSNLEAINAEKITTGVLDVDHGGTNIDAYAAGDLLYATGATTLTKLEVDNGKFLKSGASSVTWSDLVSNETSVATPRGVIFADETNNNDLKGDFSYFTYTSAKGLLSVSNINATDTSTDARNSIANASLDHTLRVGTKIICEEEKNSTHGDDALRVNGNVVVVDYILGNGRYLQGINIQQDSNGSDTFVTNDGAPTQSSRLSRFNA